MLNHRLIVGILEENIDDIKNKLGLRRVFNKREKTQKKPSTVKHLGILLGNSTDTDAYENIPKNNLFQLQLAVTFSDKAQRKIFLIFLLQQHLYLLSLFFLYQQNHPYSHIESI